MEYFCNFALNMSTITPTYNPHIPQTRTKHTHTYGVRVCPCAAFATEPCRPAACIPLAQPPAVPCPLPPVPWTFTFSAKEKDSETGYSYFGSRYYSSDLSIWLSVDPMASKYPSLSPYVYCKNSPVVLFDPDGEDAVYIAFPDYEITVGKKKYKHLGHAGVLLIDNKTGLTKYYEYGRYDKEGKGEVRKITISNVKIGKDGKPTQESLNKVLKQISNKAGQRGRIEGAYVESDKFKEMDDYAKQKLNENSDPKRRSYSMFFNNCGTFADDVIKQDSEVKKKAPVILDPRPVSIIKEYQKKFTKITYDPVKE